MKKKAIVAMLLACSFAFGTASMTACNIFGSNDEGTKQEQPDDTTVAVTGVTLNHSTINLKVNGTATLIASVNPSNATNKNVTFSSDKTDVAEVDQSGKVTAKAKGTAIITVTTASGGKTDTCTVNVTEEEPKVVNVDSVELDKATETLKVGGSVKLSATVKPSDATNQTVEWSSSDNSVASVSNTGVVTANKAGEATITVTTKDGGKTAQCKITVEPTTPSTVVVTGISVSPTSATLKVGETKQLIKTITPANATNQSVSWTSGNTAVATVDENGLVTAKAAGSATITVKAAGGNFSATCKITVPQPATDPIVDAKISYSYAGNETAAFEWSDANAAGATVEYKLSTASSYTALSGNDKEYLVRQKDSTTARVDLVGLKGGAVYDFKITTSTGEVLTAEDMTISAYDRSGYAHFNKEDGVGAYNNDGTVKSGAKIIYLTEDNKNNVDGKGNSIAQYLKNAANNSSPIVIRVVGTVGSATWNLIDYGDEYGKTSNGKTPLTATLVSDLTPRIDGGSGKLATSDGTTYYQDSSCYNYNSKYGTLDGVYNTLNLHPTREDNLYKDKECVAIKGLNSYMKVKDGAYDSCWNDCSVPNVENVTVEGIGEDAEIFQWGFTFKNSSSIEVRNLHFDDYTEDGCSFEGGETGVDKLALFKNGNIWLHHNTFDEGMNYWDVCDEQDKGDGDGSTDFKGLKNITIAYNHYIATHKTGLIGGSDSVSTASVTFHHNHYEGCNQRMPLGRQANMHMYNNYYDASTMYSISLRAGAYAFIENCYFTEDRSDHYPIELQKGSYGTPTAKIINCVIDEKKANDHNAVGSAYLYIGDDRYHKMNNASTSSLTMQRFAPDFDTNSSTFYYDGTKSDVTVMFTAEETKKYVPQLAGVQKRGGDVTLGGSGSGNDYTGGGTETPDPNPDGSLSAFTVNGSSVSGVGTTNTVITSDIAMDNRGVMSLVNGTTWKIYNEYLQSIPAADVDTEIITIDLTQYTGSVKLTVTAKQASTSNTNRYYRIDGNGVSLKSTGYGTEAGLTTNDTADTFTLQCGYKYTLITHGGLRFKSFAFVPVN